MVPAINSALSALGAFGEKLEVTANNVANVNTEGFKKSRAIFQEANQSGVTVTVSRVDTPGAPMPSEDGTGKMKESSNVDVAEEIVNLITTQRGFEGNLKTIKADEEMLGSLYDILA